MNRFPDSPFESELEVVATLADEVLEASRQELIKTDRLTLALRGMHKEGVSLDDLSAATGLPPQEIRRRTARELNVLSDLEEIAGTR